MNKSKLINLLKTFNKDEIKAFSDFINSPFFNKEKVLIKLTEYLQNHHPEYNSTGLEKEKVFSHLYPGKKYSGPLMRNITSDLLVMAEKFLTVKGLEKNILTERNLLLQELIDRKLDFLFPKNLKKTKITLEKIELQDENYYYNKYLLEDKKRRWMQLQPGKILYSDDNIQEIADDLLTYFLVDYLKTLSIMVNQKKHIYDHNFRFEFLEEIDNYFSKNPEILNKVPYTELFYKSIKLFITEQEEYFNQLRELIKKHYNILNAVDRKNMYVVLVNYCSEKINKGELKYLREKFELYKEIVDRGAHYESKPFMSHIFYKGVVRNALQLEEFTWTEQFITENKNKLEEENRESSYYFCLAQLNYKKKDYDRALKLLSKVSMHEVTFKLDVNLLLIMIYYDIDAEESLYSLFDSFSHWLTKNKFVSKRMKSLHINFINYTRKLFKIKIDKVASDEYGLVVLKNKINDDNYVTAKTWLFLKSDELK